MTNLKRIRQDRGLTQKRLAEKSGVSVKMIQKYETGEKNINHARAITVYKLGFVLWAHVYELLEDDEEFKAITKRKHA